MVLYDSIVALMAPLSECVGSGAHGKCARARQRTLSTYTIHRTRPANYISRDRADFTNTRSTARVEYVRAPHAATRPSRYYTWRSTRRVALRTNPRPSPVSHTFFLSSLLRSFNSRFSWSRRHCRRIEREPENACKWLDQADIVPVRIDSAKGFTGVTSLERGRYRFRHTVFQYISGNHRESCYFDGFVASLLSRWSI